METNRKLLDILLELHEKKRSGILRIQKGLNKKQLVLRSGLFAFAESNLPQEHLANVMIAANLIPRAKLTEIAACMKEGKTSEEAILGLEDTGLEKLKRGRQEQAIAIVASLFGWGDCEVRLHTGSEPVQCKVSLEMTIPELTVLSVRHGVMKRLLAAPSGFYEKVLVSTGNQDLPLNTAEEDLVFQLSEGKPASEALACCIPHEASPEQTLLCLYHLGLIQCINPEVDKSAGANAAAEQLEDLLARFESANFYEVLSVSPEADSETIQAAYHDQARKLHPDRYQSGDFSSETRRKAEQVFARINEAYHTLKDPESRAEYNSALKRHQGKPAPVRQKAGAAQSMETAEGLFREGRSLLAKGDVETALERLRGCVWLAPEKASYNYYLGLAESRIPKFRKSAEQHFLKAIELQDMSADCHLALARLYIEVKLPRKAEQQLEQALLWEPDNPEARALSVQLQKI